MDDTEHRLTQVEERAKSNSRRLDQVEKRQAEIGDLVTSMATMAQKQETMERDVGEIKLKVDTIAAQPGKRWDAIVDKILLGIVAALVAYALSQLGLS